jgi:hypothetical protein
VDVDVDVGAAPLARLLRYVLIGTGGVLYQRVQGDDCASAVPVIQTHFCRRCRSKATCQVRAIFCCMIRTIAAAQARFINVVRSIYQHGNGYANSLAL